nr:MAG TPA: hypothetical protein [Caudoviricetes sp.]
MCRKNKKDRPLFAVCLWLFVKEFAVAAGTGEVQEQRVICSLIDQKPVRLNVTLPTAGVVASQSVITILFRKCFPVCQQFQNLVKQLQIFVLLLHLFQVFFE